MDLKRLIVNKTFLLLLLFTSFVKAETVYIPGKLIDSLIGLTGKYCVAKDSRVGDILPSLGGHTARVRHIDWLPNGCNAEDKPARADVDFLFSKTFVKLNIPDGISSKPITELDRFKGIIFIGDTGLFSGYKFTISSFKRSMIYDAQKLLDNLESKEISAVKEVKDKKNDTIIQGNTTIYKREVIGVTNCLICSDDKIHLIALADSGKDELILLQTELSLSNYDAEKDKLMGILTSLDWLEGSSQISTSQEVKPQDNLNKSQKERNEENFKKFINGQVELTCEQIKCIGFYNTQIETIKQAYGKGEWIKLLVIMQVSNYPLDINYYYLGKAAEELKFRQAAISYYTNALTLNTTSKRCEPNTQCNGIDVSIESQKGLDRLK
jgi:hypothetical protein